MSKHNKRTTVAPLVRRPALVRGYHWFIFGMCLGGLVVNAVHMQPSYAPPVLAAPVVAAAAPVAAPATRAMPPIQALLASMPTHIRGDISYQSMPPVPRPKPVRNMALAEAGLL